MSVCRLCVFCGAQEPKAEGHLALARATGALLANNNIELVYGGGSTGMMGAVADGALDAGGSVVGIKPEVIRHLEQEHLGLTHSIHVNSMLERKEKMLEMSDGFIILPGGFGTLDETFEVLTWCSIQILNKPLVFFDTDGFWDPLLEMIEHMRTVGYVRESFLAHLSRVDALDKLLPEFKKKDVAL
jgi:uncharacterized protein (TIGR00730 family)